jgi:ATP-dependent RNA helicase RhlE
MTTFKSLNLNEKILNALESKGYTIPTPIQLQAIPLVLEGRDLFGIAQTGTGKTAAFSLPILHNLAKNPVSVKSGGVRVLILTPTRELASQIAENIELYGKELGLKYAVIFGGVSERPQITTIQRGVDILIATPGRLLDLTSQGHIRYMQLEVLVLDEADRMLDMGFINDIRKIIQKIPEKRQTLFFSATMPATIIGLANSILKNPAKIEVTPASSTVEKIDQRVFLVDKSHKLSLLKKVLNNDAMTSALVFSKTKHGANKVVEFLEKNGVSVAAIHGNKSQAAREKALAAFRAGTIKVLVATDIAARGIDIPAISHVINYDVPLDPESYVHRIGRTARAGREGSAITFCDVSETKFLREVEKVIKIQIPVDDTHPFHDVAAAPMSAGANNQGRQPVRTSRGEPRKYGFAVNKDRKISSARSLDGRKPRTNDSRFKTDKKDDKKFLGIFSFGKKKDEGSFVKKEGFAKRDDRGFRDDKNPKSSDSRGSDSRRPDSRGPSNYRSKDEGGNDKAKKDSFGFPWFKKKPESSFGGRNKLEAKDSFKFYDHKGERKSELDYENKRKPKFSGVKKPYRAGGTKPYGSKARSGFNDKKD